MANSSITLTSLDFNDYKNSLKAFLQSQSQFADYNFDASNLSVVLDLLSYNTYLNAFYMNMIGSEMFLDTAQLRDSVVLRAKELNYCPRSFRSAYANVSLTITPPAACTNPGVILTIPAGTSFTGKSGSNNYTFTTDQNYVVPISNGVFYCNSIPIYEGAIVTDTFVVQPANSVSNNSGVQQFNLSNPTIDTDSLSVVSIENGGANVIPYFVSTSLLDLSANSTAFFLQGADNSLYQIIFGDNVVGRRPLDNSVVVATYRVTNGQLPNGIGSFAPNGTIGGFSNVAVTTLASATGGDISEDINSIRYNAPRYYATQQRAVTTNDYKTLLTVTYPEIQAISVYGGDTTTPPQYGKVFISMKLYNFDAVPAAKITEYTQFLSTRAPLTIQPVFIEPNYTYASVTTTVKYNVNQTTLQPADIQAYATSAIQAYSQTNLEDFQSTLLYSKLVAALDAAHPSIVSNQTDYLLMRKLIPSVTTTKNYTVPFNMAINQNLPPQPLVHLSIETHAIKTSTFLYNGLTVHMEDDSLGNMRIVQSQSDGNDHTLVSQGVGTVDYVNGIIYLTNFFTSQYFGDSIRFYAYPQNKDNTTTQNTIFEIPNDEINVTVQIVRQ
jgi:hypothetical protein